MILLSLELSPQHFDHPEFLCREVLLEIIIIIVLLLLLDLEDHFAAHAPDLVIVDDLADLNRDRETREIFLAVLLKNACVLDHPKTGTLLNDLLIISHQLKAENKRPKFLQ